MTNEKQLPEFFTKICNEIYAEFKEEITPSETGKIVLGGFKAMEKTLKRI